jgi:hypothetical protein
MLLHSKTITRLWAVVLQAGCVEIRGDGHHSRSCRRPRHPGSPGHVFGEGTRVASSRMTFPHFSSSFPRADVQGGGAASQLLLRTSHVRAHLQASGSAADRQTRGRAKG